jgi:hypothetical protein
MRNFTQLILVLAVTGGLAVPAWAGRDLPASIGYTLYMDGSRVGHSGMTIARRGDSLVFESRTRVEVGPNVIDLTSRTEADPVTFEVRRFAYEGTKGGMPAAAHVEIRGDSAVGWVRSPGSDERRPRSQVGAGGFVVFEDWIMDLEVLLALRHGRSERNPADYPLLFANSFLPAELVVGFTGEASVESATRSMVARKLELLMSGGKPFESLLDPATGIPVYLHFPGTRAEAFRDDFFGDAPIPRYRPADGASSGD